MGNRLKTSQHKWNHGVKYEEKYFDELTTISAKTWVQMMIDSGHKTAIENGNKNSNRD